jgi:hypothetical protein
MTDEPHLLPTAQIQALNLPASGTVIQVWSPATPISSEALSGKATSGS